eukprot:505128_1
MNMHNLETEDYMESYNETYSSDDSNSAHRTSFRNRPVDWKSSFGNSNANTNASDPTIASYRSRFNDVNDDDVDVGNGDYRGYMNTVSGSQNNWNNEGLNKASVAY